ncbi:hypothetical protein FUA48_12310 [Flavobacterium alkalisoli]|uniref:HNH endonuclease n=1 Tax=Flavobacterium alkalisoli TaxID=2602769 RepID=A0A5B9FZD0_9FLAO|nr:NUMOD4 domain-containing protein [Flavobacterium alkalisoli]QEE50332.1 hypothetical protein FUA48_12310 [Flavobacterium alkalisoli]
MIEYLENEIWRDVLNYEGCYQISNLGRVKSVERKVKSSRSKTGYRTIKEKLMTPLLSKYGYYRVHLMKEGKSFIAMVHRLIAEAFIPNPNNKPQVNHINLIRTDNRIENLEWMTNKENMRHAWDNNSANKEAIKKATIIAQERNKKAVIQYNVNMEIVKTFLSIKDASEECNIRHSNIGMCCSGKIKTAGGFIWKYVA